MWKACPPRDSSGTLKASYKRRITLLEENVVVVVVVVVVGNTVRYDENKDKHRI